ncbi:MAG: phosphatidylserine decarboxylase family protein [Mariprofundales bacterium]|nr:phosphatidylserine decarboxylase family protein [Mariprofundales bacterium]
MAAMIDGPVMRDGSYTSYGFASEGWRYILPIAALLLLALVAGWCVASAVLLAVLLFLLNFFRDPDRVSPVDEGVVVAPADGRVIRAVGDDHGGRIDIFMNVFNVHVNRAPLSGRITSMRYFPGKFVNASFDTASEENERNRFVLTTDDGVEFAFTQIAGLVARRIVSYVAVGDRVRIGERIGMIRFGSRVDCELPAGYEVSVVEGEMVVAGETVIARAIDSARDSVSQQSCDA